MGAFGPRCCLQSCIWDELLSLPGLAEAPSKQLQGCLEGEVHTQNDRRQEPFEDKPKASLADAKFKKQITIVVVVAVLLIIGIIVVAVTAVMRGDLSILPGSSQKEDSGFLGLKSPNSLKDIEPTTKEVLRNV